MQVRTLDEAKAHRAAIDKIVKRWFEGEITMAQKQELIIAENEFYKGNVPERHLELVLATSRYTPEDDEPGEFWWQK